MSSKLKLTTETLRRLRVSTALRTGRMKMDTNTCHCGSVMVCDSDSACTNPESWATNCPASNGGNCGPNTSQGATACTCA